MGPAAIGPVTAVSEAAGRQCLFCAALGARTACVLSTSSSSENALRALLVTLSSWDGGGEKGAFRIPFSLESETSTFCLVLFTVFLCRLTRRAALCFLKGDVFKCSVIISQYAKPETYKKLNTVYFLSLICTQSISLLLWEDLKLVLSLVSLCAPDIRNISMITCYNERMAAEIK